ncbi:MAG: SOS response-associated peptidase [Actinobacteria bacterium]|nr:SOS response-associated peptidase [Actinomycetota bacterium]
MCGRYAASMDVATLVHEFGVGPVDVELPPRYNIAPTTENYIITGDGAKRSLEIARWGLVPSWAKDISIGNRMINARAETVATKPSFRRAYAHTRCLVPADGYYEWYRPAQGPKQPFFIHGEGTWAMAGLHEMWRPTDAPVVHSFTILTMAASSSLASIHDRMPVTVDPDSFDVWLDPESPKDEVDACLRPERQVTMHAYPVSTAVNSVRNQGPHLIDPLPAG